MESIDDSNHVDKRDETSLPMLSVEANSAETTKNDGKKAASNDIVETSIGGMGRYQIFLCLIIFMTKFSIAFHQMAILFLAPPISFSCETTTNTSSQCPCDNPIYNREVFDETIGMSWNLICDRQWMQSLSQSIFMLGVLLGSVGFGTIADIYGRRQPMIWTVILQVAAGIGASQAPEYWSFTMLRFVVGFATGGMMVVGFVLCMEFVGKKYRERISALYQIPFTLGHLMLPGFSYIFRDWSSLQLALTLSSAVLLCYYWILPESPRWLLSTGRTDEAVVVLKKAAEVNKMITEDISDNVRYYQNSKTEDQLKKGTFADLFKTPNIRKYTICMTFNWLVCGYGFYGISQYIGHLSGNIFLNVAASALVTIPGTIGSMPLMQRVGRKPSVIGSLLTSSACLFTIAIMPKEYYAAIVALACIGNCAIFVAFIIMYLYASEVFPTVVRNAGVGLSSMSARIGSMVAPYIATIGHSIPYLRPVLFGVMPLFAALLCLCLPETKDCELTNTIEEGENFQKNNKKRLNKRGT